MKRTIIATLLVVALACAAFTATLGWFLDNNTVSPAVTGSVLAGYFEGGSGTADDPYSIAKPNQLYNLAWLQYIGYINANVDESGAIVQQYFILDPTDASGNKIDTLDMSGLVLPPIGTNEEPFVGNFNGNGKTVANVTISNVIDDGEISERPLSVKEIGQTASIVGFFGVIGDMYEGTDSAIALNPGTVGEGEDAQVVNAVYGLNLKDITVRTYTDSSLIGLLAGYVGGSVENCGVSGTATLMIGSSVTSLRAADVPSSLAGIEDLGALSLYGLVGAYNLDTVVWQQAADSGANEGLVPEAGGEGAGFGGSMDMYSLIQRLTYIYTENISKKTVGANETLTADPYPVSFYVNYRAIYGLTEANKKNSLVSYKSTTAMTAYLQKGTLLPLNVDTDTMFVGESEYTGVSSYDAWTTNYYADNSSEMVLNSNTGYIVGGGTDGNATVIRARVNKLASGTYPGLYRSIGTTTASTATFDRSKFQILTLDVNGNLYVIDDDYNGSAASAVNEKTHKTYAELKLSQYKTVIDNFANTLSAGNGMIYGLRFVDGQTITSFGTADTVELTTAANVTISNTVYDSYQFLDGAINFYLGGAGYITAVAGTYAQQKGTHDMFSLYRIERNEDGTINTTDSFLIEKVWVTYASDGVTINAIKYNNEASEADGYTLVFDNAKMKELTEINAAYYFEIPVTKGDYALTSVKDDDGAYLMYLDVGANGDIQLGTGDGEGGETEVEPIHAITGVNFVVTDAVTDAAFPLITYRITTTSETPEAVSGNFARVSETEITDSFTSTSDVTIMHYFGGDGTLDSNIPSG